VSPVKQSNTTIQTDPVTRTAPVLSSAITTVVNCRKDPYDVYIGRPSKFGNPFRVRIDGTREQVIKMYEEWVRSQPELISIIKTELRGKTLGCFCFPMPCHGDVLAKIADEQ
jgi:hypothetical protein